jgi:MFS superfamily sulfate permease-like transporter
MSEETMDDTTPLITPRHHSNGHLEMERRSSFVAGKRYRMTLPWAVDPEGLKGQTGTNRLRYTAYYVPFLSWLPQYRWRWLQGDFLAAITVASLYIPMCFSFAIIAQVDPISGLYAFIIHPFIYAILGSSPQMVVGPEATGSLLVGSVLRQLQSTMGDEHYAAAEISGVITAIAGAMLLAAGVGRIGFVDSMLSRPFMQGFISGVGFVLVVEQALPELGLKQLARELGYNRSSAIVKIGFLIGNLDKTHVLTAAMSLSTLAFILIFRYAQT